jgi:hypothetical protein
MRSARRLCPEKLMRAIRHQGLTFAEAAQRARRHLPEDSRLSHTSVWAYATGRATPKRPRYVEALEKAVGVEPNGLSDDGGNAVAAPYEEEGRLGTSQHEGGEESQLIISDLGGDQARLRMRLSIPWDVAIKILVALKADGSHDAADDWQ